MLLDIYCINYIKYICSEIIEKYWFDFDAIGTDGDHVHIFRGALRDITVKDNENDNTHNCKGIF
jgi:hypothetical protein